MGREKRELIRGLLRCSRCQEMVPADQFYLLNSGRPRAWCKQCSKEYEKIRKYVRALQGNGPEWVQQILEAGKSAPGAAEDLLEEHLEGVKKKKMGYVKPFHTIPLDWLTPIWCWEVRPRSGPLTLSPKVLRHLSGLNLSHQHYPSCGRCAPEGGVPYFLVRDSGVFQFGTEGSQ